MKHMNTNDPIIVTVPPATVTRYLEAGTEIKQGLGLSPGPEFLMSLAVEHEDPFGLIDLFCGEIVDCARSHRRVSINSRRRFFVLPNQSGTH